MQNPQLQCSTATQSQQTPALWYKSIPGSWQRGSRNCMASMSRFQATCGNDPSMWNVVLHCKCHYSEECHSQKIVVLMVRSSHLEFGFEAQS